MSAGSSFSGLLALLLILVGASLGMGAVALMDHLRAAHWQRRLRDGCGDCGKLLHYRPATRDYAPHRCAPHR